MTSSRCLPLVDRSEFRGFRFPPDVIAVAVRWYLRYGLSYRDVEELLAERGIAVDHVTIYRWVQRFTPMFIDAARPSRHAVGDRWFVDETYLKIAGRWRYLYRAVDQFGQVIDVYLSVRRDANAARAFFDSAMMVTQTVPLEVVTDRAPAYIRVIEDCLPAAWHHVEQYANNPIEAITDISRLGCARCVASNANAQPGWLSPGMLSSRTCAEAITSSESKHQPTGASPQPSLSSPAPSDRITAGASTRRFGQQRNSALASTSSSRADGPTRTPATRDRAWNRPRLS